MSSNKTASWIDRWNLSSANEKRLALAVFILPLMSFTLSLVSWLIYGLDMPFYDDWREFHFEQVGAFTRSRWFEIANGTMAPVGYFLDTVAQRLLLISLFLTRP
jgi:hypothetical protein